MTNLPLQFTRTFVSPDKMLYAGKLMLNGLRGQLRHNEPLCQHTTWRLGGPAEWFYAPADMEDLIQLMPQLPADMPVLWLGLGSNLLVRDGGLRGLVILTSGLLNEMKQVDETTLRVEAGVACAKVPRFAARCGLSGSEFLAGIPGTMGGALAMNAGAFGGETWSLVRSVETLDQRGQRYRRAINNYRIGYRSVHGPSDEWFVAAHLCLMKDAEGKGQEEVRTLLRRRAETQPVGLPSCGSVFRNPPGDHAARLIDQCGLKGHRIGGAYVSEKHANFLINDDGTAADMEQLINFVQKSVQRHFGIILVPEVRIVGMSVTE